MGTNKRFHNPDSYYLEHSLKLLNDAESSKKITADDSKKIREFIDEVAATSQISPTRRYKLTGDLIRNRAFHPPYSECTISDVYKAIENIKIAKNRYGNPTTKNTISDRVRMVKRIFIWLSENGYSEIELKKLQKIKVPPYAKITVSANEVLSEGDIKRMVEACTNSRDRALISTLYEGGFRIGEIGNLTWKDIEFNEWDVTARTSEKTGKERFVPLFVSKEYLAQWKNDYPLQITPDAFVFITTTTKKPLQYEGLIKQIKVIATRAGITKYTHPHQFRHSRITQLCKLGLNEAAIKMMMWGDVNTDMLKTYLHLTRDDIKAQVAEINGVNLSGEEEAKQKTKYKPIQCPRCAALNPPTAKYCQTCGAPLTEEGKDRVDTILDLIRKAMTDNPGLMQEIGFEMSRQDKERRE